MYKSHVISVLIVAMVFSSCKNNEPIIDIIDNSLVTLSESDYRPAFYASTTLDE